MLPASPVQSENEAGLLRPSLNQEPFGGREIQLDGTPNEPIVGLPLDGESVDNFGDTVAAIRDYQRDTGLPVDGKPSPALAVSLRADRVAHGVWTKRRKPRERAPAARAFRCHAGQRRRPAGG